MTSLIRWQLSRLLAPYFEDMSSDDFSLNFFKGKGGVKDLRLSRKLLASLLPPWLIVDEARCDLVKIKVPWTSFKKTPLTVLITTVNMRVKFDPSAKDPLEQDPEHHHHHSPSPGPAPAAAKDKEAKEKYGVGGKYNFIDVVLDGISIMIERVNIEVQCPGFVATVTLNDLCAFSRTPDWGQPASLKETRVKDKVKNTITLFKQIQLASLHVTICTTTDADKDCDPFAFLIQKPILRVTTTKPLSDSSAIINIHAQIFLGRLHLVLTQGQLKTLQIAAISALDIVNLLLNKSDEPEEENAVEDKPEKADKAEVRDTAPTPPVSHDDTAVPLEEVPHRTTFLGFFRRKPKAKSASVLTPPPASGHTLAPPTPPTAAKHRRKGERGGFIPRTTYTELLATAGSSLHVHIEKILVQLSRLNGSQAQQATLRAQRVGHLLFAATINNTVLHRYFYHAPGALIPHQADTAAYWTEQEAWLPRLYPWIPAGTLSTDPKYANLRQNTTVLYVRRILVAADGNEPGGVVDLHAESSEGGGPTPLHVLRRRQTRANTLKAVFAHRQRAVLLQPTDADQPPVLCLSVADFVHVVEDETPVASRAPLPANGLYVQVSPLLVGLDPHAIFQVTKFVTDCLQPRFGAAVAHTVQLVANKVITGHAQKHPAAQGMPPSPVLRFAVIVQPVTIQLPRQVIRGRTLGAEATIEKSIITNCPWTQPVLSGKGFADSLYSGWLVKKAEQFPQQTAGVSPLPPLVEVMRGWQPESQSDAVANSVMVFVHALSIGLMDVSLGGIGTKTLTAPVLAPLSAALQVVLTKSEGQADSASGRPAAKEDETITTQIIVKTSSTVSVSVSQSFLVYAVRLVDAGLSLPVPGVAKSISDFWPGRKKDPELDAADLKVFLDVNAVEAALLTSAEGQHNLVLGVKLAGIQLALTSLQDKTLQLRAVVDRIALTQPSVTEANEALVGGKPSTTAGAALQTDTLLPGLSPQVRVLVMIPFVSLEAKQEFYEVFQARRLQLRSILVFEEEQRRRLSADPTSPAATSPGVTLTARLPLDLALESVAEAKLAVRDPNNAFTASAAESTPEETPPPDDAAVEADAHVSDDDFSTTDNVHLKPAWLQTEIWVQELQPAMPSASLVVSKKSRVAEAQQMLEDVNLFLKNAGQRGLLESPLKPLAPEPPPQLGKEPLELEYEPLPLLPQPKIHLLVDTLQLAIDAAPLQQLAEVFDVVDTLPNGDCPHVIPPSDTLPTIDVDVRQLRLRVLDNATLKRLPLFRLVDREHVYTDGTAVTVAVPCLSVHISEDKQVTAEWKAEEGGEVGGAGAGSGEETEVDKLKQQLAAARSEAAEAHRLLNDSYRALQVSAEALARAEAQRVLILESRGVAVERSQAHTDEV